MYILNIMTGNRTRMNEPPKYKESFFHPHSDPLPSREREEYGGDFRGRMVLG